MSKKTFITIASLIFLTVGLLHFARVILNWDLIIGTWSVPSWINALVALGLVYFAYIGSRFLKK